MENTDMLKALFKEATIGIIVANKQGEIIEANPFSNMLFGYEQGELIGEKIELLLPHAFRKKHVKYREKYNEKPVPRTMGANLDLYGLRKNGVTFPIEISLSYMKIGQEMFAIAYINDDSVQKGMMQELRESKERLDEAQQLAHIGSFEVDVLSGEINWSKEMYRIFGIDENENVTNQKYLSYVYPEDRDSIINYHNKIIEEKKGFDFGYRVVNSTQKDLRYVEGRRDVKLDKDGNVTKIYGLLQDVTELREARKINQDISKIIEESLNEIYIFDSEFFHFLEVNKGARQNTGYSLDELRKLTPLNLKPEYNKTTFSELLQPLKIGKVDSLVFETLHQRKNGTKYPIDVRLQYSKMGVKPVYVAFITDVSERKKYEQKILEYSDHLELKIKERTQELQESESKLRIALEKEKELGELKSRFVSMASHEFRTPLSSILSSANLISRYEKEDQQDRRMKHVKRIESSVKNLTLILNDFLSLEKLESGKVRYSPVLIDFNAYMQQIIDELKLSCKSGQEILFQHTGTADITADEHLTKNILLNLISNAIKYSPEGKSIEVLSRKDGDSLKIQVVDHGLGIPESDQKHMFTRFFRANNVTNIQGTGLGLTIVKRYLDLMNGTIGFSSEEGKGTIFTVSIPQ